MTKKEMLNKIVIAIEKHFGSLLCADCLAEGKVSHGNHDSKCLYHGLIVRRKND